jgi:hypothetical protein
MDKINNIILYIRRITVVGFLFVLRIILKSIRKIAKALISSCNFLWGRKLKIFFVIILPIIGNYFLVTYIERGVCRFELPVASHQDDLITCGKATDGVDPLSRISPDLASLLRYDLSIKNNWRAVNNPENTSTATLIFLIKDEKTGEEERLPAGESDTIGKNLSHFEVVDRLKNYAPVVEFPASGGMNAGGWELSYQPDILSAIIQLIITLVAWFQLVEIYMFLKK